MTILVDAPTLRVYHRIIALVKEACMVYSDRFSVYEMDEPWELDPEALARLTKELLKPKAIPEPFLYVQDLGSILSGDDIDRQFP